MKKYEFTDAELEALHDRVEGGETRAQVAESLGISRSVICRKIAMGRPSSDKYKNSEREDEVRQTRLGAMASLMVTRPWDRNLNLERVL